MKKIDAREGIERPAVETDLYNPSKGSPLKRRTLIHGLGGLSLVVALPAGATSPIHVYKSPSCGCCTEWAKHLEGAGFAVQATAVDDTQPIRRRAGIPDTYGSCHIAVVGGYAIEGHVPAAEIRRLLALRPKAAGLAVPSMPAGSPGMEYGSRQDPYKVFLIDRPGQASVFASYPQ